jgi:NTE family protein
MPRGEFPRTLAEVATRQKEIQYSSRTRAFTDFIQYINKVHYSIATLLEQLPAEFKESDEAKFLSAVAHHHVYNIVHLIYRPKGYESESKDYEFSRRSMEERWRAGYDDTVHTLRHPEIFERPAGVRGGVYTFDLAQDV